MKKILVSGIIALSVIGATSAAEVPSTTNESTDLLVIASNGALNSESAGVQLLGQEEMEAVRGAKFSLFKGKNWCIASFLCIF
ncbi:MAG: hypothetical protein K2N54_08585 [Helicobacter sp.]|nr:hypothetical protein [Helicobacter sp.]